MIRRICLLLAVLASAIAAAEEKRPAPLDAKAKVPPPEYRSAFEGYRPYSEQKVAPWRESNEAVKPKPAAKPAPGGGHGGHR